MAEDKVHPAQAELWLAEKKLVEEKNKLAKIAGRRASLELTRLERMDTLEHLGDFYHRLYSFTNDVSKASVKVCIEALQTWFRESPEDPVTVVFDSPGGSVFSGLALYDTIRNFRASGLTINTHSIGMAASMGGVLLQAGETRSMGKHAFMLIHEISSGAFGSFSEIEDEVKFMKRIQEQLLGILADRSTLSVNEIRKRWERRDWWLDSSECLRLGFVDEVV